ncbi:MAG: FtsW/RodA/SpoVE family cell cycle protein [Eubacteriales bacterium]|nr:FtsW/RodA/SpoVE family cell cycle protein [Eubacteriales bacterium]
MLHFISTSSNYLLMFMCAIYALSCFTVFLPSKESRQIRRMDRQEGFVYIFQIICFLVLTLHTKDPKVIALCVGQLIYFKLMITIYGHFYTDCSRILMNHTCFLLSVGFVMLARLSLEKAIKQFAIVVVASMLCLIFPIFVKKAFWLKKLRWLYGLAGLIFLATVFIIGTTKNGSTNWISLGPLALQPSEFVKISFIFFIAATLANPPKIRTMWITILFGALHVLILVLERDLGGAFLYFVLFVFMCFVATGRLIYPLGGLVCGSGAAFLAYKLFSHVQARVLAWSDPWSIIEGKGYQITQSLFAIGTGGWFGMGLTQGRPTDIPVVDSDFIFSAISEELGMVFAICILFVYIGIFVHFITIAMDVKDKFYKLLAFGFSICFLFQVFLTVGGVTKFIPSTGVTLPLISYGGSSVCSTLIIFAIMQGIFMIAYETKEEYDEEEETAESMGSVDRIAIGDSEE